MQSFTRYPKLALDRWREIIGFHPWHFWGLVDQTKAPVTSNCNTLVYQHAWQAYDRTGRNDILEAISQAEQKLKDFLGYWPSPTYSVNTYQWPTFPAPQLHNVGYLGGDGRWMALDLMERHIQAVGVETFSLIDDNSPVTFADLDGDTLNETFSLQVATPAGLTDPLQVKVYFNATDRYTGEAVGPRWEIKPISVTISGGFINIKGAAWTLVRPVLYEPTKPSDLQITTIGNFASSLDIYRVYIDPTGITTETAQAALIWETSPYSMYCCDPVNNTNDPAAVATLTARAGIRNSRLGEVTPARAVYNSVTGTWCAPDWYYGACRAPDRVTVRFQAGYPLQANGMMAASMEKAVAYLAAAELTRPICACDVANRTLYYWQTDLDRQDGRDGEAFAVTQEELNNPLGGRRRGHIYAYREIKNLRILMGFSPSV